MSGSTQPCATGRSCHVRAILSGDARRAGTSHRTFHAYFTHPLQYSTNSVAGRTEPTPVMRTALHLFNKTAALNRAEKELQGSGKESVA